MKLFTRYTKTFTTPGKHIVGTNLELLDALLETDGNTCFLLSPGCKEGPEEENLLVSFFERENKDNSDSVLTFRGVKSAKSVLTAYIICIISYPYHI